MVETASSIGEFSTGLDSSTKSFANLPFQQAATCCPFPPSFVKWSPLTKRINVSSNKNLTEDLRSVSVAEYIKHCCPSWWTNETSCWSLQNWFTQIWPKTNSIGIIVSEGLMRLYSDSPSFLAQIDSPRWIKQRRGHLDHLETSTFAEAIWIRETFVLVDEFEGS